MQEDFNPFDLSAAPKVEEKPVEKPGPKPVVNRVSFGPLIHSRVIKYLAFALAIVLFILFGYMGMNIYLNHSLQKSASIQFIERA